jgi:hypothetical protein
LPLDDAFGLSFWNRFDLLVSFDDAL